MIMCIASSLQHLQQYMLFKVQSDDLPETLSQQFCCSTWPWLTNATITAMWKDSHIACVSKNISHVTRGWLKHLLVTVPISETNKDTRTERVFKIELLMAWMWSTFKKAEACTHHTSYNRTIHWYKLFDPFQKSQDNIWIVGTVWNIFYWELEIEIKNLLVREMMCFMPKWTHPVVKDIQKVRKNQMLAIFFIQFHSLSLWDMNSQQNL